MSTILQLAFAELGTKEIPGKTEHNARILAYAAESGIDGVHADETPWCSIFVNWVAFKLGLPRTNKPNARSWLAAGQKVGQPQPGDVVIFWRGNRQSWMGHVGFFLGYSHDASRVFCIGGNQSNAVTVASYDAAKILGFRRLEPTAKRSVAQPVLKDGMQSAEVEILQIWLNARGYSVGDADGAFGPKTVNALKNFQSDYRLTIDGIYGKQCQTLMESLEQS